MSQFLYKKFSLHKKFLNFIMQILAFNFAAILFILIPRKALANVGLPLIVYIFPAGIFDLVPIVFLEGLIISRKLISTAKKKVYFASFIANLITSIIGIPLSWLFLVAISLLKNDSCGPGYESWGSTILTTLRQIAWICPSNSFYETPVKYITHLILALSLCLLVAYILSVQFEYWILKKMLKPIEASQFKKTVYIANALSYFFLLMTIITFFAVQISKYGWKFMS